MAFRYDIAIRTTVMTFRNKNGKIVNPAVRDKKYKREGFRETERLKDFSPLFARVNPYDKGQAKEFVNPISGLNNHPSQPSYYNDHGNTKKANARSWNHSNQVVHEGPGDLGYSNSEDRRGNGRNVRGRGRGGSFNVNKGGSRDKNR